MSLSKTTSASLLGILLFAACALSGCSTAGVHQQFVIQPNQGVQIEHAGGFVELREPKIEQVLTNHGMILVTNGAPGALTLKSTFQGGWATQASISLWQGDKMLAMGQAFNGGFGTLLAPGTAANDLVDRAIYTFDQELSKATGSKPGLQLDPARTYGKR